MRKELTLSQKVHNCLACQEVENLHARHCYMHCAGRNTEEIDNYWIHSDKVTWGHAFGKWTSWTGVKFGWAGSLERQGLAAFLQLTQVWPQISGLDYRPLFEAAMHTLATDIIEVAGDGLTARAYFYTPGAISSTLNTSRNREGAWMWERYGIEYAYEEGQWKFMTIQVCPDLVAPLDGSNPAADSYCKLMSKEGNQAMTFGEGELPGPGGPIAPVLDEPYDVHKDFSLVQMVQNTVPWPEPYETYDEIHSYRFAGQQQP